MEYLDKVLGVKVIYDDVEFKHFFFAGDTYWSLYCQGWVWLQKEGENNMKDGEEEKRCVLFWRSGDCLSGLDHGRFGQGLCSGCEALSGVRYADDPEGVE